MVDWTKKTWKWVRTAWEKWFFECLLKIKAITCKNSTGRMEDHEVAWEVRKRECMIGCAQLSLQEERAAWRNGCVDECDREIVGNKY